MVKRLFLNDKFILGLILLNAIIIFIGGFELSTENKYIFRLFDNIITALFIVELSLKIKTFGLKKYFSSNWNKFDFILIALSIPALVSYLFRLEITNISFLLVFRVMRVFKSFRFLKFIPGIEDLVKGIQRALKASVIVFVGFIIYIFIVGILSFYIFKSSSPEYFGNPLTSLYSTFKIFTVEGWSEIPDYIVKNYTEVPTAFTYLYFIFILLTGGIFGLSLVNSIFVDAMVSDNNDEVERKIDNIDIKLKELLTKFNNNETGENT